MSKNEKGIINGTVNFENAEIGKTYIMELTSGAIISGGLVSKYEFLKDGMIVQAYTIAFNSSKLIDIQVDEIGRMDLVEHHNEKHKSVLEYLEEFQEKHKVKCFNEDGELLSNSTILGEAVIGKKIWDDLQDEEKIEFVEKIDLTVNDIIEIINVFVKFMKENSRMHDARLRMLDEAMKLMNRYNEVQEKYPHIDKIYEVFFNDLRISELLNAI
ncbi:MAG: hypothetical protein HFG28_11475 [Eubacterium sp.]|nr:hypothetical protein [Eubacterium sp.]